MSSVEPLTLADGTVIYPTDDEERLPQRYVEVPTHADAVAEVTRKRMRLNELPETPKAMNVISVVLSYDLLGVSDTDIASVLNLPEQRIGAIKLSEAYATVRNKIVEQIMQDDAENIRATFRRGAKKAAGVITELVDHPNAAIALAASKDLLDRDGHRPSDVVEHRHKIEGGLVIEHISKKNDTSTFDGIAIEIDSD